MYLKILSIYVFGFSVCYLIMSCCIEKISYLNSINVDQFKLGKINVYGLMSTRIQLYCSSDPTTNSETTNPFFFRSDNSSAILPSRVLTTFTPTSHAANYFVFDETQFLIESDFIVS